MPAPREEQQHESAMAKRRQQLEGTSTARLPISDDDENENDDDSLLLLEQQHSLEESEYMFVRNIRRSVQQDRNNNNNNNASNNRSIRMASMRSSTSSTGLSTTTTNTNASSLQHNHHNNHNHQPTILRYLPVAVFCMGLTAALVVVAMGVYVARREQTALVHSTVTHLSHQLHVALDEFTLVAQWVRASATTAQQEQDQQRLALRQTYEYVTSQVLQFGSVGLARMVRTREERERYENDTRTFLQEFIQPEESYQGFHNESWWNTTSSVDYNSYSDGETRTNSTTAQQQQQQREYLPIHWLEPIVTDLISTYDWLDLDLLAHDELRPAVDLLRERQAPVLTRCTPCFGNESVVLLHPGIPNSWEPFLPPEEQGAAHWLDTISLVEIRFDWLLFRVFQRAQIGHKTGIFVFDSTEQNEEPTYLSGAYFELSPEEEEEEATTTTAPTDEDPAAAVDPQAEVSNVYNAIVGRLQGSNPNIWKISSAIDFFKRQAIADYTQPDGSIAIEGSVFQPYLPAESVEHIQDTHDRSVVVQQDIYGFRRWTIVVTASHDDYPLELGFVTLSAVMIVAGCACLALWIGASQQRSRALAAVRTQAAAEKTDIVIRSARQAAKNERELNDFIAHEIRNPLAACMSACSFVKSAVSEAEPLRNPDQQESVREDVGIMENSLQFMNDLLRNMLDIHRASSKQLALNLVPLDVLHDVLEPAASMLYHRSSMFTVQVECANNLTIMADKLRLKQVILNLGRNATKFVERGFIRLRAAVVDGKVVIYVEDSGPGIPESKRQQLFQKFQESLDTLQQGTGIGLAVCRSIMDLMGGSILLDESYDSGEPGAPGSRFVVSLNTEPISSRRLSFMKSTMGSDSYKSLTFKTPHEEVVDDGRPSSLSSFPGRTGSLMGSLSSLNENPETALHSSVHGGECRVEQANTGVRRALPETMSVLFVDDDMVLRKLFVRSISKALPEWSIDQCSNGETALRLTDEKYYDIIFMDQYMASADRQLLGTETVQALRAKGVASQICGLSANDMEDLFLQSGADHFHIKPIPCKPADLKEVLRDILVGYEPPFQSGLEV